MTILKIFISTIIAILAMANGTRLSHRCGKNTRRNRMENYNLKNGLTKMKRTELADGALTWARQAYLKNGPTDSITITNILRLVDILHEVRTLDMTAEEWNAVRRYYVKKALGGEVDG